MTQRAARKPARRKPAARSGCGNDAKYQQVTDRIVTALEAGTVPWRGPWITGAGLPMSMSTGRAYRGVNVWLLGLTAMERGYSSRWWGTYDQIAERSGMERRVMPNGHKFWVSPDGQPRGVREGENKANGRGATPVVLWQFYDREETDPATGEKLARRVPSMRFFYVFNAEQADGLSERYYQAAPEAGDAEPIESAQKVLDGFYAQEGAPALLHDQRGRAYFHHVEDAVHMTPRAEHESAERYYSTAFHESTHATGHHSRLGRREEGQGIPFGSHEYGKEELVAEMGAAMLCAETGVETAATFEQSAAYLASWIRTIKEDPRMVVSASSAAQKAVDLILEPQRQALPEAEADDAEPSTEHGGQAQRQADDTEREAEAA